jgi:serine/threonine protein kinase
MKPLSPNTLLQNRYLIVQLIGKGGMGEVYLAVDQRLGSAVALKRTFFSENDLLRNAFEREARTLARLRHPVLPKVSDHFTEQETQYLVMEHISGDDLSKRLEVTRKPFPLNWVLFWADQLLDALAYLHSHEPPIVHRDIKPQNLKLTNENHIILLDFGLAKDTGGQSRVSTTGGSIVGYTPHYAPMEQIRGTGTTAKSDIYSLSATLYQLLTAQVPPDALTRADSILNSLPDPTEPIDKINPEVPRVISDVIFKGMALSMDARYANAREMQKALREAYAQMQSKMSAETMAFTLPQQQQQQQQPLQQMNQPPLPQSQQLTEQFTPQLVSQPQPQPPTQLPPTGRHDSLPSQQRTENLNIAPPATEPDFEATIRDANLSPTSLPSLPSQQKTEVLPTGISPQVPAQQQQQQQEESFNPEATVPIISFDQNAGKSSEPPAAVGATQAASNFDSVPTELRQPQQYGSPYNTAAAAAGTTGASGGQTQTENVYQPASLAAAETKKKSGKGLAIAGILGGLVILMLAAAGVGLYAFGDRLGITGTTPTPTPTAQPSVTPTAVPSPTIERANTGTGNSTNQQVAETGTLTNTTNAQVAETNKTTQQPATTTVVKPVAPTQQPPPARQAVTTQQPVRTQPPVTRTTPKPTTAKPPKPVLLQ